MLFVDCEKCPIREKCEMMKSELLNRAKKVYRDEILDKFKTYLEETCPLTRVFHLYEEEAKEYLESIPKVLEFVRVSEKLSELASMFGRKLKEEVEKLKDETKEEDVEG